MRLFIRDIVELIKKDWRYNCLYGYSAVAGLMFGLPSLPIYYFFIMSKDSNNNSVKYRQRPVLFRSDDERVKGLSATSTLDSYP